MDPKSDALTTPQFLLVLLLFAIVVYANYLVAANPLIRRYIPSFLFLRRIEKKYKQSLVKYSSFYNYLSEKDKISFEKRVQKFIDLKQFTPRAGIKEVTPEMKAMIAATAIQLTFGYPNVYFKHFKRILIYPDNYYSTITRAYHKGEVNIRGIIVLSWKSFHDGFINPTDGINLDL